MLGSFSIVFLALCASWEADLDLKKIKKERSLWEGRRQAGNKQWELTNRKSVEAYHRCSQRQIDGSLFCFLGSSACSFLGKQNTLVCWLALGWATPTFTKLFRSLIKENVWKMCSEWKFNSSFPFSVFVILRLLCSHLVFEGKKKYTDWDVWRTIKGGGPWGPSVPARCASCRAWFYPIASSADEVASRSLSDVLPWRRSNGLLPPPPPPVPLPSHLRLLPSPPVRRWFSWRPRGRGEGSGLAPSVYVMGTEAKHYRGWRERKEDSRGVGE